MIIKKYFYIHIFLLIITTSCNKDNETLIISDFTEIKEINLKPNKYKLYSMKNIWVKGYVNDTILIRLNNEDKPIMKLSGKIDKRWYTDYYGEGEETLIFDPYKATEGELEIIFEL